jgi:hypothetical protein
VVVGQRQCCLRNRDSDPCRDAAGRHRLPRELECSESSLRDTSLWRAARHPVCPVYPHFWELRREELATRLVIARPNATASTGEAASRTVIGSLRSTSAAAHGAHPSSSGWTPVPCRWGWFRDLVQGGPSVATRSVAALGGGGRPASTRVCFLSSSTAAGAVATGSAVRDWPETDKPGGPREPPQLAAVTPGFSRTGGVWRAPAQGATLQRQTRSGSPVSRGVPLHTSELQSEMDQQASELKVLPGAVAIA